MAAVALLMCCVSYLQPSAKKEIVWDSANQGEERGGKGELWFLLEFCDKGCLQVWLGHQVSPALHCIHLQPQVGVMACCMHSEQSYASGSHASGGRAGRAVRRRPICLTSITGALHQCF